jgi:RNA polymerase-binding transcription factor DksA
MTLKPSQNEEEYARKQETELLAKRKKEAEAKRAQEEKEALKAQHFMRCPKCGQPLQEERYHMVHVDRCTACGGVWFDAGEAEGLLDKSPSALQGFFGDLLKGIGGGKPTS